MGKMEAMGQHLAPLVALVEPSLAETVQRQEQDELVVSSLESAIQA